MIEVAEKAFKVFLSLHEKFEDSLSHYSKNYGHNIEKLRARAEIFNQVFGDQDIKQFSRPFDDRSGNFFQKLRYGSHSTIVGFETNLGKLMPIVDKIFFNCILNLEDHAKRNITNSSLLYFLITNSELDQSNNPSLLLKCVQMNNPYYSEYEKYCVNLKAENQRLNELFKRK